MKNENLNMIHLRSPLPRVHYFSTNKYFFLVPKSVMLIKMGKYFIQPLLFSRFHKIVNGEQFHLCNKISKALSKISVLKGKQRGHVMAQHDSLIYYTLLFLSSLLLLSMPITFPSSV